MGPLTTYTNEPAHLAFTYSPYIQETMGQFYGQVEMLPVLERFRIKATKGWDGNLHVDHKADIPIDLFECEMEIQ